MLNIAVIGAGRIGHVHAKTIAAQMRVQPKLALRQRLRVRIHLLHVFQAA